MTRGRSGGRQGGGLKRQLTTRGQSGGRGWGLQATADDQRPVRWGGGVGGCGLELEATADDQRQRCVLWGEVRQWELESARREGEGKGAPQQQSWKSTACQNGRRTRSAGLEALGRC